MATKKPRSRRKQKPLVFMSFASSDLPLVAALHELLTTTIGKRIIFYFAPRAIAGGVNWQNDIAKNLKKAKCVLVFLSPTSTSSQWVLFEAGFAHGKGKPMIPVGIRGLRVDKQRPPLSSFQGVNLRGPSDLNDLLDIIGHHLKMSFAERLARSDYERLPGRDLSESSAIHTEALLTRRAIYRAVTRLVEECDINAQIRATSTVYDPDDSRDQSFSTYLHALATKCGTARAIEGRIKYHIVLGITRNRSGVISRANQRSIRERVRVFEAAKALPCLKMFEVNEKWTLNLLLVNHDYAVFGFPEDAEDPKLQYGVLISGSEFVAPLVEWYDRCIEGRAKRLNWREFLPKRLAT